MKSWPFRALILSLLLAGTLRAEEEERRLVVALFDSKGQGFFMDIHDPIHELLEMPLNHLGMVVRRHDIRSGPPREEWVKEPRAILTYFSGTDEPPPWLWPWLEKHGTQPGVRVIHFGEFGPLGYDQTNEVNDERLAKWLRRFGFDYDSAYVEGPIGIKVEAEDPELVSFESNPIRHAIHWGPVNRETKNRVWIQTYPAGNKADTRHQIVTGDWGGIALHPWTAITGGDEQARRWFLNPFAFFRAALGLERVPAPHPAMLNGRRMFFLHLDGDGFESLSTVQPGEYAAKVFLEEVIDQFELPFTISIIVAGLTDDYQPAEPTDRMLLARKIFSRPNVESGSHAILHPLRWDLGTSWYKSLKNYEYDQVEEARGSVQFINRWLVPKDRPCRMMLWSGEANPSEGAILGLDDVGSLNINGGVYRWDSLTKSMGYVSPWARRLGSALQVYAGAANENDFLGFFTTMPGAFRHIEETIRRSGSPRILKPANVYCHFYSAERPVRLSTLKRLVRRWGIEQETAPVFASVYCRAVRSATRGARIYRLDDGWRLEGWGDCRSVRIDGEPRSIDFAKSSGVIGQRRIGDALQIHLGSPDAEFVLAESPSPRPHVEQANHLLTAATLSETALALTSKAVSRRVIVVAGLAPNAKVGVHIGDVMKEMPADPDGRLEIALPPGGPTRIRVAR